jgi:hypothetical protein
MAHETVSPLPDREIIGTRIEAERNKLLGVLGTLRVAAVAAGNTGEEKPSWDDMEIMLLGAAEQLREARRVAGGG